MTINSLYPVIASEKLQESKDFYTRYFPFEVTFENDWYISLILPGENCFQLALLDPRHESIPEEFREAISGGMLLNFEVDNVDAEYERFVQAGLPIHLDLRSEDWGQRHFITEDPNGILIDMIKLIPPSEEYAKQYSPEALEHLGA